MRYRLAQCQLHAATEYQWLILSPASHFSSAGHWRIASRICQSLEACLPNLPITGGLFAGYVHLLIMQTRLYVSAETGKQIFCVVLCLC